MLVRLNKDMIYDLKAIRSIQIINNSIILIGICVNSNSDNELIKYVHISSELENVNLLFNRIDINEFAKDLNTTTIFSDLILYALQCNDLFKSSKILDKNIKDVTRNIKAKQKQTDRW